MASKLLPPSDYMLVQIEEVDIPNRIAHVRDKTGVITQVAFNYQYAGLTFIPSLGELWRACRYGFKWYLEDRVESTEEFEESSIMEPGDARFSAASLDFKADSTHLNFRPIGSTIVDVFHLSASGYTSVTLTHPAISEEVVHPTLNGIIVPPSVWIYDPNTRVLTFNVEVGEIGFLQVSYETWMKFSDDAAVVSGRGNITAIEEFIDV